jgi:hypothetical protein
MNLQPKFLRGLLGRRPFKPTILSALQLSINHRLHRNHVGLWVKNSCHTDTPSHQHTFAHEDRRVTLPRDG